MAQILFDEAAAPGTPAANKVNLYAKSDGLLYSKDDAGTETLLSNVSTTNVLLDGANHTDTVAQTVSRGSLIYGNSTPKWDELVVGAANTVVRTDGTDAAWGKVALTTDVSGDLPFSSFVQASAASKLIGRGSASGAGDFQEISLGNGLTMSTTTLTADATGTNTGDQLVFKTIAISGQSDVVADTTTDTLTLVAGTGITLATNASTDTITITGTSGGAMQHLIWLATGNNPPASAYATPDTRNSHPVLDFDGATDEEAVFAGVLPSTYAGGGLTAYCFVAFTSATSGSGRIQAAIERIDASSLDIDADSFASFNSTGVTAPGTSGQIVVGTITFTSGAQMDSLAAGEAFRLKIRRDADGTSGTDDITTDMELLRVEMKET